jgi:hypothetical protein
MVIIETGREGGRDGGWQGGRDGGRQGGREGGKCLLEGSNKDATNWKVGQHFCARPHVDEFP